MCVSHFRFFVLLLKSWEICDNVCILDYCHRILRFFVGFFPIFSRWWFQICFIFPIWGRFPIWLIFFKGVGSTTNQFSISIHVFVFWFSIISSCIHSATIRWIRWFFAVFSKPRGWCKKRRSWSQRNAGISRFVYKLPPRSRDDQGQIFTKNKCVIWVQHRIHVWYSDIYIYYLFHVCIFIWLICMVNRGKHTIHGCYGTRIFVDQRVDRWLR